jgi:polyisoprenyl-phosphate glycosyltransferase
MMPTTAPSLDVGRPEPLLPLPLPLEARGAPPRHVSVVIPAYNEEAVLTLTYETLRETLDGLSMRWSILFVNDGSRDTTSSVLAHLHRVDPRVGYILLSRNFGHQAALTAGLDHADADVVITMDADLQHPPRMIPVLLQAWRDGYDVVHTKKLKTVGLSSWRAPTTRFAYDLIARISEVEILPHASDFRLLDRHALEALREMPERGRLYRGLTPWVGFRQCAVPYVAEARAAGESHYGMRQLLNLFARALFDFSSAPLKIGLWLGGTAMLLSILYLVFILLWHLFGESAPPGWASTVSVTLFLNSVTLTFLGIIGVYVARIYNEVRRRPTYLVGRMETPAATDDGP